jgi:hypothetical protein
MNNVALPILTLILGTVLGLISSLIASFITHRRTISVRLLDQFLEVRKELINTISTLSNLTTNEEFHAKRRAKHRDAVTELYYKHFDFLPTPVLDALVLLSVALAEPAHGPYKIQKGTIVRRQESEIIALIDRCLIFTNAKLFARMALKSRQQKIREIEIIKLHARNVLYTLNEYASISDLSSETKRFKKRPLSRLKIPGNI